MAQTGTAEEVEKYSKRTVRVTRQHNDECKRLLTLMGVPIIEVRPPRILYPNSHPNATVLAFLPQASFICRALGF